MQYVGKDGWKAGGDSRMHRTDISGEGSNQSAGISFGRQLEVLQEGAYPPNWNLIVMRHTPPILQALGLWDRPILFARRHVENCLAEYCDETHCHGIAIDTMRKLPGYLTYPVMVLDSEQRQDSIVVVTEGLDHLHQPVIASIRIEGMGSVLWPGRNPADRADASGNPFGQEDTQHSAEYLSGFARPGISEEAASAGREAFRFAHPGLSDEDRPADMEDSFRFACSDMPAERMPQRPRESRMRVNYITACYGKRPRGLREMIRRAVHDGRILYADSVKLSRLFYRLQLEPPYEVRWIVYDCVAARSRNAEWVHRSKERSQRIAASAR